MSRIGSVLTGDRSELGDGPAVHAMIIQNQNPLAVCPDSNRVRRGFARDDLFVATHEQFLTETARWSDIVLPATMFMEHDDIYQAGGHSHIQIGPKLIEPPGECRSNHEVLQGLASRLGARHRAFEMTPRDIIDETLQVSGRGGIDALQADLWRDIQPDFRTSHYLDGFAHADGKFHFKADWGAVPMANAGLMGAWGAMPSFPDHWAVTEQADDAHPFRLATSPSRSFLNSTFNETPSSQAREGAPSVMMHPEDAARLAIVDGDAVTLGNPRGETTLTARIFPGLRRGVLIAESVHPNRSHIGGHGINMLTGGEAVAPYGGAAFHDNKVWVKKVV
jgi:anaerobic selenocysteine-containing dehydrogenase